jgi:phenylalanyl-tRNA synthetase beta chain
MKVTLNWLKEYVEFDWSPEELSERLTMIGMEVEGMEKLGGEFEGVVVARILSSEKHPNADKLSVCRVEDGKEERQIVCGAKNYKVGDKIPLALPGATLPGPVGGAPFAIKTSKMRGVESQGMMCSAAELGLAGDGEGLMILAEEAKVGQPFSEHLGRSGNDVIYDLEITPNRPDLNSVIGIAREISAVTGNPLKLPPVGGADQGESGLGEPVEKMVSVRIEDAELCPRYTARIIQGLKVGPSPDWLRSTLEKVGLRSINNVVDVTNFVMLESGQPLHAFDYHLLRNAEGKERRPVVVVRRAQDGELFVTIDGEKRTLMEPMLVIADETRAIGLAGIMGGQNTEINDQTVDVLLESACFKPQNIRATAKKLELRTDASYRFERGADVGICEWASRRAVDLILETAGGTVAAGVLDAYPNPVSLREVELRHAKVDQLLGVEIPAEIQVNFLRRLGLDVRENRSANGKSTSRAGVPTFRVDLKREVDLIEEIGRLHGIEKIPATPPRGALGRNSYDEIYDQFAEVRRILAGLGLTEAQGQTLIGDGAARMISRGEANEVGSGAGGAAGTEARSGLPVFLANPLSSDMNVLRPSLIPGLLDALRHNAHHKVGDACLFEIGKVFVNEEGALREERRLALALTGRRHELFWQGENRDAKMDLYDLKGILEECFDQFGLRGMMHARNGGRSGLYLESARVQLGKNILGEYGQLLPPVAKRYDLRDAVLLAELNLDLMVARRNRSRSFKPLPAFPAIRRDVAMIVPESTTHEAVLRSVKDTRPQFLEQVELFDIFRGKNVPEGEKSMAYAFTYRNAERTLTDAEVNAVHEKVVESLREKLRAKVREG